MQNLGSSLLYRRGTWDAFDIFLVANTEFWKSTTDFKQAAEGVLAAMKELKEGKHMSWSYGHIDVNEVVNIFKQVGINCALSSGSTNLYTCTT